MGTIHGNCYESNPNEKWKELNTKENNNKKKSLNFGNSDILNYKTLKKYIDNKSTLKDSEGQVEIKKCINGKQIKGKVSQGKILNGQIRYENGDTYNGEIKDDMAHGIGEMTYQNGDYYKGRFVNNQRNGVGVLKTSKGKYSGSFVDDVFHGQGVFEFDDGAIYNGNFMFDCQLN